MVYAGTYGRGLYRSTDGGTTWQSLSRLLSEPDISSIAIDTRDPEAIYVGSGWGHRAGLFKSGDGGRTWIQSGLDGSEITSIAVDPNVKGHVYAATSERVYKSEDAGATWSDVSGGKTFKPISLVVIDPSSKSSRVYLGTLGEGLFCRAADAR